jgi:NAD(P)-dependent dehydrogenase (short-subunit alcohol dehydrogenase family)
MGNCNNTKAMRRKVYLIGGTGAVGRHLCSVFDHEKYDVDSFNSKEMPLPELEHEEADIVINLAGITTQGEMCNFDPRAKAVININCIGAVNILNAFLPYMQYQGYGRIIFISSVYSAINVKKQGIYSASKAFVDKLVKIAALENTQYGITVNSIQLGYMGMGIGSMNINDTEKAMLRIGMERFCTPKELYNTIEYIINTEYLTGQNIRLDGGIR